MSFPAPELGLVINYVYLWRREQEIGITEGSKSRPCAVILAIENNEIFVSPITHSKPSSDTPNLEIPLRVKKELGLGDEPSWIILNEMNGFKWVGYDVRSISRKSNNIVYGHLPPKLFEKARKIADQSFKERSMKITNRN